MSFDVQKVRTDFPILQTKVHGKQLVYLDNAATTQKPNSVIDAISKYYQNYNSNIHRGVHRLSEVATKAYLTGESNYNATENKLYLPAIMGWFRRDFGGKKKMINMVKALNIVPEKANPSIEFKPYDWTLYLENYKL